MPEPEQVARLILRLNVFSSDTGGLTLKGRRAHQSYAFPFPSGVVGGIEAVHCFMPSVRGSLGSSIDEGRR